MYRPARQCLSRCTFRLFLFVIIISCITWVFLSHSGDVDYRLSCSSSKECYDTFMDTARNAFKPLSTTQQEPHNNDNNRIIHPVNFLEKHLSSLSSSSSSSDALRLTVAKGSNNDDGSMMSARTPEDEEYARLTNSSQERVKAAFVVLARNKEVYSLRSSMRYLEDRFNHKFNYPWIFLNEQPFSDEFIRLTRQMTNAETYYGLVPEEHWSYPDWINQTRAQVCREEMERQGIVYGGSESYRHMCRYQSGFFMWHPLLDGLDYYW